MKKAAPPAPKLPSFGTLKKEVKKAAPPQVSASNTQIQICGFSRGYIVDAMDCPPPPPGETTRLETV